MFKTRLDDLVKAPPGKPRSEGRAPVLWSAAPCSNCSILRAHGTQEIVIMRTSSLGEHQHRRNGCRERTLATSVSRIRLRMPRLMSGSHFPEDLLTRYSRTDRAVVADNPVGRRAA